MKSLIKFPLIVLFGILTLSTSCTHTASLPDREPNSAPSGTAISVKGKPRSLSQALDPLNQSTDNLISESNQQCRIKQEFIEKDDKIGSYRKIEIDGQTMGRSAKLSIELPYNAQFQTTYTINDTKQEIDYVSYSFKNYSVYNPARKENYLTVFVRNHKLIGVTIKDEASGEGGALICELKADPLPRTN